MAMGFLQSFDNSITVCSAGTEPAPAVNKKAIEVMKEAGIDISANKPVGVTKYIDEEWDFVITVCDEANETCPVFIGKVGQRLHFGFEDPSKAIGDEEFIYSEFRRIRDDIHRRFMAFYNDYIV